MARVMKEAVDHYVCDACGKDFYERKDCSLVFRANEDITFEWWTRGDYCNECLLLLANAICLGFPVAERYDLDDTKIPKEIALIEAERLRVEGEGECRWQQLFGTPERAARTLAGIVTADGCADCALLDATCCRNKDAWLEWLRGDAK